MNRNTQVLSVSLPPDIYNDIENIARIEKKTKSELIRAAVAKYKLWKFEKDWEKIRKIGDETRKKFGFRNEDELFDYIHGD